MSWSLNSSVAKANLSLTFSCFYFAKDQLPYHHKLTRNHLSRPGNCKSFAFLFNKNKYKASKKISCARRSMNVNYGTEHKFTQSTKSTKGVQDNVSENSENHVISLPDPTRWLPSELDHLPQNPGIPTDWSRESLDLILHRKVLLVQSLKGYRVNTDSVMLAYFAITRSQIGPTSGKSKELCTNLIRKINVMDLGCGSGLVGIIFARACYDVHLNAIEVQHDLYERACRNVRLNQLDDRAKIYNIDLMEINSTGDENVAHFGKDSKTHQDPSKSLRGAMDVVLCNPPYYKRVSAKGNTKSNAKKCGTHSIVKSLDRLQSLRDPPKNQEKFIAHVETSASIIEFMQAAMLSLKPGGKSYFIYDYRERHRLVQAVADVSRRKYRCSEDGSGVVPVDAMQPWMVITAMRVVLHADVNHQTVEMDNADPKELFSRQDLDQDDMAENRRRGVILVEVCKGVGEPWWNYSPDEYQSKYGFKMLEDWILHPKGMDKDTYFNELDSFLRQLPSLTWSVPKLLVQD